MSLPALDIHSKMYFPTTCPRCGSECKYEDATWHCSHCTFSFVRNMGKSDRHHIQAVRDKEEQYQERPGDVPHMVLLPTRREIEATNKETA